MSGKRPITDGEQALGTVNTNTTAGPVKRTERFDLVNGAVEFHSFSGTPGSWILQGTIDGNNWTDIQAAIVADAIVTFTHQWKSLRVYCTTAGVADAPTVSLFAHEFVY